MPWLPALAVALSAVALSGLAAGCATMSAATPVCAVMPDQASLAALEVAGPSPWWLAGGILIGLASSWLWRRWRLARALHLGRGLIQAGEVANLQAALRLIDDLVLRWQGRGLAGGGSGAGQERETAAPGAEVRAGAAAESQRRVGIRPGGRPPAR